MPETCLVCGRTYLNAWDYDDHTCIDMADIAFASLSHECHEEVSRRGLAEPCELQSVGLRVDPVASTPPCDCSCHTMPGVMHVAACCQAGLTAQPNRTQEEK